MTGLLHDNILSEYLLIDLFTTHCIVMWLKPHYCSSWSNIKYQELSISLYLGNRYLTLEVRGGIPEVERLFWCFLLQMSREELFVQRAREAFQTGRTRSLDFRIQQLNKLQSFMSERRKNITDALKKDLGKVGDGHTSESKGSCPAAASCLSSFILLSVTMAALYGLYVLYVSYLNFP